MRFLICFSLCYLLDVTVAQDPPCTIRDQCSCVTNDGKIIDLSSLGNKNGRPRFYDMIAPDNYMYSYNPCYPFDELNCKGQSVCQIPPKKDTSYQAGDANSAVFINDGINNHVKYSSTDSFGITRKTDVTLMCDPTGPDDLIVLGRQGSSTYYMTLRTKCACPDGCTNSPPPNDSSKPSNGGDVDGLSKVTILGIALVYSLRFVR